MEEEIINTLPKDLLKIIYQYTLDSWYFILSTPDGRDIQDEMIYAFHGFHSFSHVGQFILQNSELYDEVCSFFSSSSKWNAAEFKSSLLDRYYPLYYPLDLQNQMRLL